MPHLIGSMQKLMSIARRDWPLQAFVVAVPTLVLAAGGGSYHDASRLQQLGVLLAGALLMLTGWRSGEWRVSRRWLAWTAGLAVLAVASVAGSAMPAMAWREVALTLGIAGLVAATAGGLGDGAERSLRRFGLAALVGSTLYAFVLCLLALTSIVDARALSWPDLALGYDNYRFFNHVQTVALPLLALQAQDARLGRPVRWAAWFAMAVYWAFVFCSGARGTAFAVFFAVAICVPFLGWRTGWSVIRALLVGAAAGAVAYVVLFFVLPVWAGYPVTVAADRAVASLTSDNARLLLWDVAMQQIMASPWLGVGPMHYAHYPNPKATHPHNIYLQVAAEWGIPMLIALLAMAGRGLLKLRQTIRSLPAGPVQSEGAGLWICCIAVLADGAVSGNFVMPVSQMWIAFALAWTIAWIRLHGSERDARPADRHSMTRSRLAAAVLALSQVWLIAAVWHEATDLDAHLSDVRKDLGNAKKNPRFWSDGWF
jgi:O-antigen ligase